jgi:hypothetical protein
MLLNTQPHHARPLGTVAAPSLDWTNSVLPRQYQNVLPYSRIEFYSTPSTLTNTLQNQYVVCLTATTELHSSLFSNTEHITTRYHKMCLAIYLRRTITVPWITSRSVDESYWSIFRIWVTSVLLWAMTALDPINVTALRRDLSGE